MMNMASLVVSVQRRAFHLLVILSWLTVKNLVTPYSSQKAACSSSDQGVSYADARNVRTQAGHEAAMPMYQSLLCQDTTRDDVTAASRLAAAPDTPSRHDAACPYWKTTKISELRQLLSKSQYTHESIEQLFGVPHHHKSLPANGPLYLKPPMAGTANASPLQGKDYVSSLECLVTLFLLGIAVPRVTLEQSLEGGFKSVELLQELGLAFPCQVNPQLLVPYVHIFPVDISILKEEADATLFLVTDLHPRILSSTTVGTGCEGAVMYIGPDSLALVQHHLQLQTQRNNEQHGTATHCILDLCTGSGIQALSTLVALQKMNIDAAATCVDCNERSLRFTKFNAVLNSLGDRVKVLWADLVTGECRQNVSKDSGEMQFTEAQPESMETVLLENDGSFDTVLANPPFIPVPPQNDELARRYGLFSSGGSDGEQVLRGVLELAPKVLSPNGMLGVVSEFMNPPSSDVSLEEIKDGNSEDVALLQRICHWWTSSPSSGICALGMLFTNQFPVSAETYASRRADTPDELEVWKKHLSNLGFTHISPGLLFAVCMPSETNAERLKLHHRLVPKTSSKSIWTPSNTAALAFTRHVLNDLL